MESGLSSRPAEARSRGRPAHSVQQSSSADSIVRHPELEHRHDTHHKLRRYSRQLAHAESGRVVTSLGLQLRPEVLEGERAVEDEGIRGRVSVNAEVAQALELHGLTDRQLS
jgi:hypothetical protein